MGWVKEGGSRAGRRNLDLDQACRGRAVPLRLPLQESRLEYDDLTKRGLAKEASQRPPISDKITISSGEYDSHISYPGPLTA